MRGPRVGKDAPELVNVADAGNCGADSGLGKSVAEAFDGRESFGYFRVDSYAVCLMFVDSDLLSMSELP